MSRTAQPKPATSCPFCLSWGVFRRADSCCRGCYDFGRTYPDGECAGCRRVIAVKNRYCRLCWLQRGNSAGNSAGQTTWIDSAVRPGVHAVAGDHNANRMLTLMAAGRRASELRASC